MATELTWFHVFASIADGTTLSDNAARYTNQTRSKAHIIKIMMNLAISAAEAGESATFQLAKQNTFGQTDGDRELRFTHSLGMPESAASADGSINAHVTENFLRGQLGVDFGDSLFMSVSKTTGGVATGGYWIGLEYED